MFATEIEDVGIPICGGVGYLVEAEDLEDPEWVGTNIFQSPSCIVGCFVPACGKVADLCIAGWPSGGLCNFRCSDDIDEQSCRTSVLVCNGIEPEEIDPEDEACGLDPSGGDDSGDRRRSHAGLDESGSSVSARPLRSGAPAEARAATRAS